MHRRPAHILAVLFGIVVVFVAAIGLSGIMVLQTFNRDALANSKLQVGHAVEDMVAYVEAMTLDYAKWDDAALGVARRDEDWLYSNIGGSAAYGEAIQLAIIWGGPFAQDLGWTDDGTVAARPGLVTRSDLALVDEQLAPLPRPGYEGTTFFLRRGDDVFTATASRIESLDEGLLAASGETQTAAANLLLGVRVDENALHHIEEAFHLSGVQVVTELNSDDLSFPLPGSDGEPVAFITWDTPRPAAALLARMLPGAFAVLLLALGLSSLGIVLVRRNVADLVAAERQASQAARTDALTGLPNRAAFNEALARPAGAGERAILFLDVNGFKHINDSIGHAAGDEAIVQVGHRLSKLARPSCVLARIAGDEFVFMLQGPDAEGQVRRLAAAVQATMAEPFHLRGHDLELRMAMGYAVQDVDDLDGHVLVGRADLAMYEAKRGYGHDAVGFSAMIADASNEALSLEQALRRALTRPDEFSIAYQPIVDHHGRLVRAEALARWTSAELGSVPPDRFIAVAERAGLIVELGRRLLELVCRDLGANPELRVSVNVSPLQLMAPDFTSTLLAC
jgi:diguanylate cyclase (GGDEF)-like protein